MLNQLYTTMWFTYSLNAALLFALIGLCYKRCAMRTPYPQHPFLMYLYGSGGLFATMIWWPETSAMTDPYVLSLGIIMGSSLVLSEILIIKALHRGPISLVMPIQNLSMVYVVLASYLAFGEWIPANEFALVATLITLVVLLQGAKGHASTKPATNWLTPALIASIFIGARIWCLKMGIEATINVESMIIVAYLVCSILLALMSLREHWFSRQVMTLGVTSGILSIIAVISYVAALELAPVLLVLPIVSISYVLMILGGYLIFKERLSKTQLALITGIMIVSIAIQQQIE